MILRRINAVWMSILLYFTPFYGGKRFAILDELWEVYLYVFYNYAKESNQGMIIMMPIVTGFCVRKIGFYRAEISGWLGSHCHDSLSGQSFEYSNYERLVVSGDISKSLALIWWLVLNLMQASLELWDRTMKWAPAFYLPIYVLCLIKLSQNYASLGDCASIVLLLGYAFCGHQCYSTSTVIEIELHCVEDVFWVCRMNFHDSAISVRARSR